MSTTGPRCPNHQVPLTDKHKGVGICPVSGYRFAYKTDETEKEGRIIIDTDGKKKKINVYKITPLDGDGG